MNKLPLFTATTAPDRIEIPHHSSLVRVDGAPMAVAAQFTVGNLLRESHCGTFFMSVRREGLGREVFYRTRYVLDGKRHVALYKPNGVHWCHLATSATLRALVTV